MRSWHEKFGRWIVISILMLSITQVGLGQILTFEFSALAGNEATASSNSNDANIGASTISRGAGLTASANGGRYNATVWAVTSIANAVSGDNYMEFTITPNSGYEFAVSSIYVQLQRSSTGPRGIAIRNSIDSYASNLDQEYSISDVTSTQNFTFTFSQANSSSAVTYRIYKWAESTSGSGGIGDGSGDDLIVYGTVTATGGVSDPTGVSATTTSTSQINLAWTLNGNSNNVMVAWNSTNTFGIPSGVYSVSDPITDGGTVIYNGSGTGYNHTSLSSNTAYYYKAWSVDGTTTYSSGVTANATTYKVEPTNHVTGFSATKDGTFGYNRIDLAWTENDGAQAPDGYLIKSSTSDNVSDPVDGTAVSDNLTIGSNDGSVNIAHGNTSYEWTNLTAEQTYYFKIYPYTNSGSAIDYKTTATVPNGSATTDAAPVAPAVFFSEYIEGSSNNKAIEIYNGTAGSIDLSGYSVKLASNGGGWGSPQSLSGSLSSYDVYVVYNSGASTSISDVGDLSSGVTNFNGNDAVGLFYGDLLIDVIGTPDTDPGTAWAVAASSTGTLNHTLVRKQTVTTGNTNWTTSAGTDADDSEWIVYDSDTFLYLGSHSSDASLPVELSSWKAISTKGLVKLLWTTDSEIENQGFIIERSLRTSSFDGAQDDGSPWKEIASFATNDDLLGQGSTSAQNEYFYIDKQVKVGKTYSYCLSDVDYRGNITRHAEIKVTVKDAGADLKPSDVKLHKAFPNPFNPDVNLSFTLENEVAELSLEIYDIQGALVQTLSSGYHEIGNHDFKWNGFDTNDNAVSSGVYMVRLSAGSVVQIQRVTLLR